MNNQLIPGIIGGMGPEATIELMTRILKDTKATDDKDHLRLMVDNNPKIPSRIKAIIENNGESPAPHMIEMAKGLVNQGADFLVIPCNTAHYYYQDVANSVSVPVIDLIDITALKIKDAQCTHVGMLGSTALQITHLYEKKLAHYGLKAIYPDKTDQDNLMIAIKAIKAQSFSNNEMKLLENTLKNLSKKNIDCLALVCTEFSVISDKIKSDLMIFDAMDILSKEIINRAVLRKPNL